MKKYTNLGMEKKKTQRKGEKFGDDYNHTICFQNSLKKNDGFL